MDIKEDRRWARTGQGPGKGHIRKNKRVGKRGPVQDGLDYFGGCGFKREKVCQSEVGRTERRIYGALVKGCGELLRLLGWNLTLG